MGNSSWKLLQKILTLPVKLCNCFMCIYNLCRCLIEGEGSVIVLYNTVHLHFSHDNIIYIACVCGGGNVVFGCFSQCLSFNRNTCILFSTVHRWLPYQYKDSWCLCPTLSLMFMVFFVMFILLHITQRKHSKSPHIPPHTITQSLLEQGRAETSIMFTVPNDFGMTVTSLLQHQP